jgi:hypothetical protein
VTTTVQRAATTPLARRETTMTLQARKVMVMTMTLQARKVMVMTMTLQARKVMTPSM